MRVEASPATSGNRTRRGFANSPKKAQPLSNPTWYKNTYFWISGALIVLGLVALVKGPEVIRDPGQMIEGGLPLIYLVAGVLMFVNGYISHAQTMVHFHELVSESEHAEEVPESKD